MSKSINCTPRPKRNQRFLLFSRIGSENKNDATSEGTLEEESVTWKVIEWPRIRFRKLNGCPAKNSKKSDLG